MKEILRRLPHSLTASFRGRYAAAHVGAIALTALIVLSGFDWWYFEHTRGTEMMQYFMVSAGLIGFAVPFLVPLSILIAGILRRDDTLRLYAWLVAEAEVIAWLVSSTYKAFTGRLQPEFMTHFNMVDISREFQFGFWEHGIFWGWPSSHAATACAMAAALFLLFPKHRVIRTIAPLYALYVTVAASIGFHWLSDALAGALIGGAIGISLARLAIPKAAPMKNAP